MVTKRNGQVEEFDLMKIITVLHQANKNCEQKATAEDIKLIADDVEFYLKRDYDFENLTAQNIQDVVEKVLIQEFYVDLAKSYIIGCYNKTFQREKDELDKTILDIVSNQNSEISTENANKNAKIVSTQRDYMAGEVSKRVSKKYLLDKEVVDYHNRGIIHVHDLDYFVQPLTNCCLVNIEDMLTNGTMIGNVAIDSPKSLRTAGTVLTQIIQSVASSQFGGATVSLAHLAPYVDVSRQKLIKEVTAELTEVGLLTETTEDKIKYIVDKRLRKEIKDSIQTINYQLNSFSTTNGRVLPL